MFSLMLFITHTWPPRCPVLECPARHRGLVSANRIVTVAHIESEAEGIDSPMKGQEKGAGDRNQAIVEDTIEYEFRVRRNHVTPFADTPANRVEHPEKPDPAARNRMHSLDVST